MNGDLNKVVGFEVNKYGWVLLFRIFGKKAIIRAERIDKKNKRVPNENGHRMEEVETEGSTIAKPKYDWDISKFPEKI